MISVVLLLDGDGNVILSKKYRPESKLNGKLLSLAFSNFVVNNRKVSNPVVLVGKVSFIFVRHRDMYIVGCTTKNVNVAICFDFLYKLLNVLSSYIDENFSEQMIRDHFLLAQEILEEMMDFGYPQLHEISSLEKYMIGEKVPKEPVPAVISTGGGYGINYNRSSRIKYNKNELFLDIIEELEMFFGKNGEITQSLVYGRMVMKSYLSGDPECALVLGGNFRVDKLKIITMESQDENPKKMSFDHISLNSCARIRKNLRKIAFIPNDGEFTLISYRLSERIEPPFKMISSLIRKFGEKKNTTITVDISLRSLFDKYATGRNLEIRIPLPKNYTVIQLKLWVSKGKVKCEDQTLVWRVKKFLGGGKVEKITGEVEVIVKRKEEEEGEETVSSTTEKCNNIGGREQQQLLLLQEPIRFTFKIRNHVPSQMKVKGCRVVELRLNYKAVKWIRYLTKGVYERRI